MIGTRLGAQKWRKLPEGVDLWGIARQQLPVIEAYTSHNSSACVVADIADPFQREDIVELAADHIREHFVEGGDPGLCVIVEKQFVDSGLIA